MSDELAKVNRLLDDLAAERAPVDRDSLTAEETALAETAAFLKAAAPERAEPDPHFVEALAARLAGHQSAQPVARSESPGVDGGTQSPDGGAPSQVRDEPPVRSAGVSRRTLIGRAAAAAAGIAAGAGAGEVLRGRADDAAAAAAYDRGRTDGYHAAAHEPYKVPMAPPDRGRWMDSGHTLHSLPAGQAARFRAGAIEGFLVNPGGGKPPYALSASCTHMGCMLSWLDSTGTFLCPCHGAQYQSDGTVLSGIARQPLPRLKVRVNAQGMVQVWSIGEGDAVTTLFPYNER